VPYNNAMSHPQILIPFSLPPAEHAKDLVKMLASETGADGLALLLARNKSRKITRFDDFSRLLPHEDWLSKYAIEQKQPSQLLQLASQLGVRLSAGYWFIFNPIHLHIASNHLVLTDQRQLNLSDSDAQQLFNKAQALCSEVGIELVYGSPSTWFLRGDDWSDFVTASPDAACGHNIEIWSAKGSKELAWRKLQNEIQMEWFIHPVQEQRAMQREKPVNGAWLWGGTQIGTAFIPNPTNAAASKPTSIEQFIQAPQLLVLDQLSEAALAGDWSTWAAQLIELEKNWLKPLAQALKSGQLKQCDLYLSHSSALMRLELSRSALRQFWHSPSLKPLITPI